MRKELDLLREVDDDFEEHLKTVEEVEVVLIMMVF